MPPSGTLRESDELESISMGWVRSLAGVVMLTMAGLALPPDAFAGEASAEGQMATGSHFVVVSSVESPSPDEILDHLERTWRTFLDLFGVEPSGVRVVLSMASG